MHLISRIMHTLFANFATSLRALRPESCEELNTPNFENCCNFYCQLIFNMKRKTEKIIIGIFILLLVIFVLEYLSVSVFSKKGGTSTVVPSK